MRWLERALVLLAVSAALLLVSGQPLSAAQITVLNMDPAGQGLNDPTPVSPVTGNPGTTLGQQRLNVFQAAADYWGARLLSDVTILVEATMMDLFCDQNTALLGQAGAATAVRDWNGAPMPSTWYPISLGSALAGQDLAPGQSDIIAQFNSLLDSDPSCLGGIGWSYIIDAPTPGQLGFYTTVLHEMAHGLGFASFVDETTGETLIGFNDVFSTYLRDESSGESWTAMSNSERRNSAINTSNLTWTGPSAIDGGGVLTEGVHGSGRVQMYAPNPVEPGSSVSHWDTAVTENELMEPFITSDAENLVTTNLLEDIGWGTLTQDMTCVPDADTLCLGADDRFKVEVTWRDFSDDTGVGVGTEISTTSGLLYFFNPNNLEMLIKVLDGCGVNDRFWVFFAATTNVGFQVAVTDTDTGRRRTYTNQLGQPANAVIDTNGFSTCNSRSSSRITDFGGGEADRELDQRIAHETADMFSELERSRRSAVELRAPNGDIRTVMPVFGRTVAMAGEGALLEPMRSPVAMDRLRVDHPVEAVGPVGSTYTIRPLMAKPNGDGFDLFTIQEPGSNDVTFDDKTESIRPYCCGLGTKIRVREEASLRADGTTLDISITLLSRDGSDLFPSGFTAGGDPLTGGGVAIGFFAGEDPLDFDHERVQSVKMNLIDDAKTIATLTLDTAALGGGAWNGRIAVVIDNVAGQDIDAIEFEGVFELGDNGGGGGGGGGGGEDPGMDGDPVTPFTCIPGNDALCLNEGRFEVEVDWRDFESNTGTGTAETIGGSSDSGLFWFFNPNNIEMLVKVLDGCAVNDEYWVFFAATTDVEFTVTVTDTDTGNVRLYSNELGQPANAVTDTAAFATCP